MTGLQVYCQHPLSLFIVLALFTSSAHLCYMQTLEQVKSNKCMIMQCLLTHKIYYNVYIYFFP